MVDLLRPKRGGFLRAFGCGIFIRDFLMGKGPHGSAEIDSSAGAPQADIFREYKIALSRATAMERALATEEKSARREKRFFNPDNITELANRYLARMPYKAQGCRYHSFVTYFSDLVRLGWVEPTGKREMSEFQDHYPPGQSRKYFRLTQRGINAGDAAWANPHIALYGRGRTR